MKVNILSKQFWYGNSILMMLVVAATVVSNAMRLDALFGEVIRNEITFFAMHLCDISSVVCVY